MLFRITSPLRGLKHCNLFIWTFSHTFRIISPLRGLKPNAISWESSKVAFRITTPLWGLKRTQVHCRIVFNTPLEFLPHSGDIKLTYLQLHTTNQKSSDSKEWLLFYISIFAIVIYPTYVIAFIYI